jgi:hypothetical protein
MTSLPDILRLLGATLREHGRSEKFSRPAGALQNACGYLT